MLNEEFIIITKLLDAIKEKDMAIADLSRQIMDMQKHETMMSGRKLVI